MTTPHAANELQCHSPVGRPPGVGDEAQLEQDPGPEPRPGAGGRLDGRPASEGQDQGVVVLLLAARDAHLLEIVVDPQRVLQREPPRLTHVAERAEQKRQRDRRPSQQGEGAHGCPECT